MTFISLAIYYNPPGLTATWAGFWYNQSAALVGNIIGGGLIIGGSEYFIVHWHSFSEPSRHAGKWGRRVLPSIPPPEKEMGIDGMSSNDLIRQSFVSGLAELDPGMAFTRAPTLISTSDPVVDSEGKTVIDGRMGPQEVLRSDSIVYMTPAAYRRATGLGNPTFTASADGMLSPAAPRGTFSLNQMRPVFVVEEEPPTPISPLSPVALNANKIK
jgi:hypothetical protein